MKKSHRSLLAVALLLSILLLSACGTTTVRKSDEVKLARRGLAATNLGPARSVDCPGDVAMKVGKTFDCHLKLVHGTSVTFTLKIDKTSGNGGHMTIVGAKQP